MSRQDPNFENSFWGRFSRWLKGEYDPSEGRLETRLLDKEFFEDDDVHYVNVHIGKSKEAHEMMFEEGICRRVSRFTRLYRFLSVFAALFLIALLLWTVSYLPRFGDPGAPENNEVSRRYIEKGLEETGAINIVAGMILDYRAFDTFGETCVLFIASSCVLFLLRVDKGDDPHSEAVEAVNDCPYEPRNDLILQKCSNFLVPFIIMFGIYVVLNGHLSPGGGFSGGAILGAGLILYLTAYGFERTHRFMNEKVVEILKASALIFYCFSITYFLYTGANELHSIFTTGTPGNIISAGLLVYLNTFVGIEVACTMYTFYTLFRRGGI